MASATDNPYKFLRVRRSDVDAVEGGVTGSVLPMLQHHQLFAVLLTGWQLLSDEQCALATSQGGKSLLEGLPALRLVGSGDSVDSPAGVL